MIRRTIKVAHKGQGILELTRSGVSEPKIQRVVLSHVNVGAGRPDKGLPKAGKPVIIPLFSADKASAAQKELSAWVTDTIREIDSEKRTKKKQARDRNLLAHLGNQRRIYTALERLSSKGKGNISQKRMEYYGVPDKITKRIAGGHAKLRIKFHDDHTVDLKSGRLLCLEHGDTKEYGLGEEELARLLLGLEQISLAQINIRSA